ncbi:sensor histidine kinase [Nitratidesulfovibrio sp. SRB-5]|uniref:sensor histidine kinase n=1 Tax=Nitratidesulfovibrio sp. SRB-5 TaxID=2872636 RepID=UPI001027D99A|nr:ATP-binding protein [Nitratidesulfovibrio sp. SRB-5]MBZ2171017.1 ATP-binding protein [Nitratidesulfovibrio sp. SRB-5]RXF77033.1 ATP-binding protein [Desulfovibrio sp. DS-1]
MTRLLHDHAGTGLCAVAPSGRVLGMSGLFLRALGLVSPPPGAMLHDLLPLSENCPPCAGWHWLLDLPPALHDLPNPHDTAGKGRTYAAGARPADVRGGMLVRTLSSAEVRAIPGCPALRDPRDPAAVGSSPPASHGRAGVLLQLRAPDLPDWPDIPDRPVPTSGPGLPDGPSLPDGPGLPDGPPPARHPAPACHGGPAGQDSQFRDTAPPTPTPLPVPDAHLRQALDALSVGLAHDFGNVVASILGFAEIAISRLHAAPVTPHAADPMVLRSLDNIVLGCQRARDVIAFAQSVAGRMDLNAEPVDLHALVTAWCAELAGELPPDVRWAVSCGLPQERHSPSGPSGSSGPSGPSGPPGPSAQSSPVGTGQPGTPGQAPRPDRLPPVRVDAARLREAFAEIWRNAAWAIQGTNQDQPRATQSPVGAGSASPASPVRPVLPVHQAHPVPPPPDAAPPAGRVLVETTLAPPSPRLPGRWVRVRVRDTGKGMDADTLCRMRDPYFSTKARHEGKGRGLARAAGIVRAHGGRLDITAGPGLGCMVDILLPVAD